MRRLFEHKLAFLLVIATVLIIVVISVFSSAERETSFVENTGGGLIASAQSGTSKTGNWFLNIANYFGSIKSLREENEKLKNENTNLQKEIRDMQGLESENTELRKMVKLMKQQPNLTLVAATVSAKDPSNWYSTFTINRGSDDGIKINQPIVNANRELVGQVSRVGDDFAEVITVLDTRSSIGVSIERSKEIGILEGDSELRFSEKCRLNYIARDTDIKTGDFVETSGLGGVFPKGLVIGKITDVYDETSTMSKVAIVEPLADISKVNEVFVITDYKNEDLSGFVLDLSENRDDEEEEE